MSAWIEAPFEEAVADVSAGNTKTLQSDYRMSGQLRIVDQGKALIAGYTENLAAACKSPSPVIVFGDHTRALKFVDFPFGMGADGVKVLKVRDGWDTKFVYHYLRSLEIPSAGYSRHFKFLRERHVPRPPLTEQRRIAVILDQADALRAKRREALGHLDDLAPSLVSEMISGTKVSRYPRMALGEVTEKVTVGHVGPTAEYFCEDGVPFLRTGNIGALEINRNDMKHITHEFHARLQKSALKKGDVLVSRVISDEIRCAVIPPDLEGANCANVIIVRPGMALDGSLLSYLLRSPGSQRTLLGRRVGSAQSVVNTGVLRSFTLPVPPPGEQAAFAEAVSTIDDNRSSMSRSLLQFDRLFDSLRVLAFQGVL